MTEPSRAVLPFNSPLETGIRATSVLAAAYPRTFDLQRLVAFDYLVVHTGDIGGPISLHPALPFRSTALLIRRHLVERGLLLMISRCLVERTVAADGISFGAGELAETFVASLESPYIRALDERARWVVERFGGMDDQRFRRFMHEELENWSDQFESARQRMADHL